VTKFLIGVAMAALWFALSHAANAEGIRRQVCDNGTCVSRCVQRPDSEEFIREREHWRHHDGGFDLDTPAGDVVIHR
jgi:hypothetical protein